MESIKSIKDRFSNLEFDKIPNAIDMYRDDSRTGVRKLIEQYQKKYNWYKSEIHRIADISKYENIQYSNGKSYIAGVDEVGRGPLAGPVMAAAVILPKNCSILYIDDSKKLSPSKREMLSDIIHRDAISVSIGSVNVETIDKINILQSTYMAMQIALKNLSTLPDIILVDALNIPKVEIQQLSIIGGDAKSISIAAASIVAKVERDKIMDEYHKLYPEYGFNRNKGYGTKEHIEAIKKYGICPIHRITFLKNLLNP